MGDKLCRNRDYAALSHAQRMTLLARMQRHQARLDAARARLLATIERDRPAVSEPELDKHWDREEVACILRVAGVTAGVRMRDSADLINRYPATLALLETGAITLWHAQRLVEAGIGRSDAVMAAVEQRVLRSARQQSVGQFKAAITRALAVIDPDHGKRAHEDARGERCAVFSPQPDGTTNLWAPGLSTHEAVAMAEQIRGLAHQWKSENPDDDRTSDQRQSDALAALVLGTGLADGRPTVKPTVNVTVSAATLLGLDEAPGEINGAPVPAAVARAIAFDPTGTWRRLLTDENNRLVDVAADTYRPPANMARLVRLQQQTCCFPGCRRRAIKMDTELDHIVDWQNGGPTTPSNLQPLCGRHHHLKHDGNWTVYRDPDGTTIWTSPTGNTYARPPDDLPIDRTMSVVDDESAA